MQTFHEEFVVREEELVVIDWMRVAEKHEGILIAPYLGERLTEPNEFLESHKEEWWRWYYSWDCASGCIWNPNAVSEFLCRDTGTELR
jgi:hypothetical protein